MKRFYFLFIVFAMVTRFAHAQDTTALAGKMEFIFAQLNRSDISTGFLEQRAFPLVSITPYNGTLTDSNKVNINTLRAAYFTHYTGCMLNTNPMLTIDSVNKLINQYLLLGDSIPIAIHFGELNTFKSDAVVNNLISIGSDDVLHDVSGRPDNPYLLKYLFAASPLKSNFATGNFSMIFKPNLFFTNSSLTVSALYVDFDDGDGYQSAVWNTKLYPNYSTAGTKNIKIKIVMSNSSQYECYAPITVDDIPALLRYDANSPDNEINFPSNSYHSGGRAFVRFSSSNSTGHLKKPLIVVEGYDAARIAPNLTPDGNYSYNNFIDDLTGTLPNYDFNYQLDDIAGYDLVFIDYAYGTDHIERNAKLFEEVLNWVNTDKAYNSSTEKNVVLGISMGGLVARYGLAQMTKNNESTDTRLLITHDSPHQGANVPVGLQKIVQSISIMQLFGISFSSILPQYKEMINLLNEPASTQMLIYKSSVFNGAINTNTWLSATYRPMVTFTSSNPQPEYRFIATSQGSECGNALFIPASQLLNAQASGSASVLFGLLGGKFSANIQAKALPALGNSTQLAKVSMTSKIKVFFVTVSKHMIDFTYTLSSSSLLPIDGTPGGISPVGAVQGGVNMLGSALLGLLYSFHLNGGATLNNFTFVPTPSALDIQNFNAASLSSSFVGGVSYLNPSRADNFIAQEERSGAYNESHTRFTARNAEWIFKEMEGISNTLNCSESCIGSNTNISISGPVSICDTTTYYINNLPQGMSVSWSIYGWGAEITQSNNSQVQVVPNDEEGGEFEIIATIGEGCGKVEVNSSTIISGFPYYVTITDISNDGMGTSYGKLCSNARGYDNYYNIFSYDISSSINISYPITLHYELYDSQGLYYQSSKSISSSDGSVILPNSITPGYYSFEVWLSNGSCVLPSWRSSEDIQVVNCGYSARYVTYPNPSSTELNIVYSPTNEQTQNSKQTTAVKTAFSVKLFNNKGKVLKQGQSKQRNEITLQVADVPDGTYYLHIFEGKKVSKQQVIIKH